MLPKAVLFDLDGTIVDTSPDLVGALGALWAWRNRPGPLPTRNWDEWVPKGALSLIEAALGPGEQSEREAELAYFLRHYEANIFVDSRIFDGIKEVLDWCMDHHVKLGIVTNKRAHLANRLLSQAGLDSCFSVVVGGDSLAVNKPHPEPLWAACEALAVRPNQAVMVGDDHRDVVAASRAGMNCMVACWGYGASALVKTDHPDAVWCRQPKDLIGFLKATLSQ